MCLLIKINFFTAFKGRLAPCKRHSRKTVLKRHVKMSKKGSQRKTAFGINIPQTWPTYVSSVIYNISNLVFSDENKEHTEIKSKKRNRIQRFFPPFVRFKQDYKFFVFLFSCKWVCDFFFLLLFLHLLSRCLFV